MPPEVRYGQLPWRLILQAFCEADNPVGGWLGLFGAGRLQAERARCLKTLVEDERGRNSSEDLPAGANRASLRKTNQDRTPSSIILSANKDLQGAKL